MNEKKRVKLRREKIGFTFQSNNLIPYLTARENVEFMLRLNNKLDRAGRVRSDELLARLGLSDRLHNLPAQMSGVQQQRVAIARTWVLDPDILLMDEPFAALDAQTRLNLERDFLKQWAERESTVIFVTHDLPEAIALADRVIVLGKGKIIYDDKMPFGWPRDPETVLADPRFGQVFAKIRDLLD